MTDTLRWNNYLDLRTLTQHDEQPVCEECEQTIDGIPVGPPLNCPACAGTGHAPCWKIEPTPGMLYADGERWFIMRPELIQIIANWEPYCQPGSSQAAFPPLLPPASLCDPLRLLELPAGAFTACGMVQVPLGGGFHACYGDGELYMHFDELRDHVDPDAAILAANRFKALTAWIAAAKGAKE